MPDHLMDTYARMPVAMTRGEGAWLWDEDGKRYLDATSGLGVCALGHAHPGVARAIADQAARLLHTGNIVQIPLQEELAERLCRVSGMERAFLCNSGAEAIECALKLCRLIGHGRGIDQPEVVVMESSFHGRTLGALSATGSARIQAGFEPLVSGFTRVPFGDIEALRQLARPGGQVVAVLLEPIQGESGVRVPPEGYLAAVRALCDAQGWLMVCDEIQTGLCRTGRWYAFQYEDVRPDILTTAKALGNGFPVAACLGAGEAATAFTPGKHGSTFGGNPLACRTACAVLDIMQELDLPARVERVGGGMLGEFRARLGGNPRIADIRGKGLMIGIEADRDVNHLKDAALEAGLLMNVARDSVVRLLPPLIIDDAQAAQIVETVVALLQDL